MDMHFERWYRGFRNIADHDLISDEEVKKLFNPNKPEDRTWTLWGQDCAWQFIYRIDVNRIVG